MLEARFKNRHLQLAHFASNDINTLRPVLSSSPHSCKILACSSSTPDYAAKHTEVGVEGVKLLRNVSLGDDTKVERVVEEVVVKSELTAE